MEVIQLPSLATKLPLNFKCCLIGSSGSGKFEFISKLIKYKDQVFQEPYDCFIYCSPNLGTHSSKHDLEFKRCLEAWSHPTKILFYNKVIEEEELLEIADSTDGRVLTFIDDFSRESLASDLVYSLFTKFSTHRSCDVCLSLHIGSSSSGKWYQAVHNNSSFIVLFRNISNRSSIGMISKAIFPYGENFLMRALNRSTDILGCYSYVCVDTSLPNPLNNRFGVRSNIFCEQNLPIIIFKNPSAYKSGVY